MIRLNQTKIIQELSLNNLSLFTVADFKRFFSIAKDNTAYKTIARLKAAGIIKKLAKKRYVLALNQPSDFQIANFLYSPSYISLESALSFYSIIAQFPYQITSLSLKKTKIISALNKEFAYFQIKSELFFDYEKKEQFLIAKPEKALLDYLYFCAKGLRNFEKDDFDLSPLNRQRFKVLAQKVGDKKIINFVKTLNLCF